jgi:DNA polymerase-3 subunit delta
MMTAPIDGFDPAKPLTLVYGAAAALRRRYVDRLVATNLPEGERQWGLMVLDAAELGAQGLAAQIGAGSLMADTRVIVVRNAEKLPTAGQNALAQALRSIPPATFVILDADAPDDYRRKGPPVSAELRKTCEAVGQVVEAKAPGDKELPKWVAEEAAARGKRMGERAAQAFVQTVGTRADYVLNELEKLVTYVGEERHEITADDVAAVVCGERESTVFDLVDAIGRRDVKAALAALPDLLPASGGQGAAMPILAMISRQLRLVWQARALTAAGLSLDDAGALPADWEGKLPHEQNFFDATRGRRFLVRKYQEQARNFSDTQLVRALVKVYETDLMLKGQTEERMGDRLALETLIVRLCAL